MEGSKTPENPPEKNVPERAERLRERFRETTSYDALGRADIRLLCNLVNTALSAHERCGGMSMAVSSARVAMDADGSLRSAFVRVDGPYFEDREAISLNADGFVGFAGWADSKNVVPFLSAFDAWIDALVIEGRSDGR